MTARFVENRAHHFCPLPRWAGTMTNWRVKVRPGDVYECMECGRKWWARQTSGIDFSFRAWILYEGPPAPSQYDVPEPKKKPKKKPKKGSV